MLSFPCAAGNSQREEVPRRSTISHHQVESSCPRYQNIVVVTQKNGLCISGRLPSTAGRGQDRIINELCISGHDKKHINRSKRTHLNTKRWRNITFLIRRYFYHDILTLKSIGGYTLIRLRECLTSQMNYFDKGILGPMLPATCPYITAGVPKGLVYRFDAIANYSRVNASDINTSVLIERFISSQRLNVERTVHCAAEVGLNNSRVGALFPVQ